MIVESKMKTLLTILAVDMLGALTVFAQPTIITQPTNQIVFGGSNVTFSVAVSGTGPFTYQWQSNGTNLPYMIIATVAGEGSGADGGPANKSSLNYPCGVAADNAGNFILLIQEMAVFAE